LINLNDIKGVKAIKLLREYEGKNPYIKKLKHKLNQTKKLKLTENQSKYIIDNHDKEPQFINKIISITEWLGDELMKNEKLSFSPKKIQVLYMLADSDKTYHIYGKLKQNQDRPAMYFIPKTQVLDDPYFEDIDIDVDFDKYKELDTFKLKDGTVGRTPYEHQKSGIKFLLTRDGCILADDMGLGKCLSINELVYTPNGLKVISDLKVGDYVIGSNGLKTKVIGVYPQKELKKMYKITFNDGYSVECTDDHMWTVTSNNGSANNKNREVRYTNLTVEQMLDKDLVLEQPGTGWNEKRPYKFKTYYKQSNGQNKWQIPIVKPIHFENNQTLPVNPYLLGVSLGDGHINKKGSIHIELHKDDFDEIFNDQIINEVSSQQNKRCNSIHILKEEVKTLGLNGKLSHTKFIPDMYKYSSIEDRLAILQGLMDTDGHCMESDKGVFVGTEYCTVSEQLADDVAEIVHSLGGIVRKKSKIGSYKKEDGTKVECKVAYRLNIKLPEGMNPFRLKRKAKEYNPPQKYKVGRYIKDIEYLGMDKSICIKVEAEDSLFTLQHGIVTHNTYQSIIAALESGAKKILIVCPSSVKINWEREINYFQCFDTTIISGQKWSEAKFTIINYDILKNFHALPSKDLKKEYILDRHQKMLAANFDLCIIDEAHKLKNKDSKRGTIMSEVCKKIPKVWLLSGTPVANRPMDFYNLLKLIKSPLTTNWKFFAQRYCEGRQITTTLKSGKKKRIWLTNGASNLDELNIKTKNILIRRMKTDIGDMPDKNIIPMSYDLNKRQISEYENLWEEYLIERIEKRKKGVPERELVELGLLRKFVAMEMIPNTIKMAEEIIEQGHKVIIFTNFTDEIHELHEYFGNKSVIHYGEMNDRDKQKSVDDFQNKKKTKVFIGNIISAGVGITLTEATYVIFNSFDWVPGNNDQAEDRAYRLGQKNNVTVYYQLFQRNGFRTISEIMWDTIKKKKNIIDTIMGQKNVSEDEAIDEVLKDIMKKYE